jgi:hypothetical protein
MSDEVITLQVGPQGESVGRTVHYVDPGAPLVHAAIITGLHPDGTVTLYVLRPGVTDTRMRVPFSETYKRSHWSWPQRVKGAPKAP